MEHINEIDSKFIARTCGSYRRGRPNSGDIDILLTHPSFTEATKNSHPKMLENIIDKLNKANFLTDTLSSGHMKYMGVCQLPVEDGEENTNLHRRIDIRLVPIENYWCGLLYFTGSDFFNTQMRYVYLNIVFKYLFIFFIFKELLH